MAISTHSVVAVLSIWTFIQKAWIALLRNDILNMECGLFLPCTCGLNVQFTLTFVECIALLKGQFSLYCLPAVANSAPFQVLAIVIGTSFWPAEVRNTYKESVKTFSVFNTFFFWPNLYFLHKCVPTVPEYWLYEHACIHTYIHAYVLCRWLPVGCR